MSAQYQNGSERQNHQVERGKAKGETFRNGSNRKHKMKSFNTE